MKTDKIKQGDFFIKQTNKHRKKKEVEQDEYCVTKLFANVLADEDNRLAASLERLALKKQPTTKYLIILKNL